METRPLLGLAMAVLARTAEGHAPATSPVAGGELLAAITAELSAGGDLDAQLQQFLDPVVRLSGARGGMVRVLSDDGTELRLVGAQGLPAGACAATVSVGSHCGVCGAAVEGRCVRWADEAQACATHVSFHAGPPVPRSHRLLAVPLQHRGEVLGVYNLLLDAAQPGPAPELLAMLRSVGELLGLALHHARLEQVQLRAAVLHERQNMAAEVHDSLGQSLAFIKMRMPLLEDALNGGESARALRYCAELRGEATRAHASLRSVLTQLRAPMDAHGLLHALQVSAEQFRGRGDTTLDVVNEVPGLELDAQAQSQVFHIVQEALSNVSRHAQARHAWLHLARDASGQIEVRIEDDGTGLTPGPRGSTHYGLDIMRERAGRLGGQLDIGAREGGGTCVRLRFPSGAAA